MLRFFKSLFGKDPSLDYNSIGDPKTFQTSSSSVGAKEVNTTGCVDAKTPLLSKAPEGPKR